MDRTWLISGDAGAALAVLAAAGVTSSMHGLAVRGLHERRSRNVAELEELYPDGRLDPDGTCARAKSEGARGLRHGRPPAQ